MTDRLPLPIDAVLPEILDAVSRAGAVVLEAPPGAGKTTRVPPALLDAGLAGDKEVLVLQPRRLAARLAATRVAEERGEKPGATVGWQVRFEDVTGPKTRLKFLTEGVLTRRLLSDPDLPTVGAVVLDEFHERHLDGDLALALLRRLQSRRPDLKLLVMSATLDAAPVATWLGNCPSIRSEGRRFDVAIEYVPKEDPAPLSAQVAGALKRLVAENLDGHILVFLPGAAEIRRTQETCAEFATRHGLRVLPLYGDLPPGEQDAAVRPSNDRKVILSTNVAETSVTIDNVVAVIDAGLARVASVAPWSGIPVLKLSKISKASAAQRAGRAGRTRPGRAIRLYTRHDHDTRPEHDEPEIRRLDLADTVLSLAANAIPPETLDWFEPPPAKTLGSARDLLTRLGALSNTHEITPTGRRMLRFPVHPRLSRLILEADARGEGASGCLLAALIAERTIRARRDDSPAHTVGTSDLLDLAAAFNEAASTRFAPHRLRALDLDPGAVRTVERVRTQLTRRLTRDRDSPGKPPRTYGDSEAGPVEATLNSPRDSVNSVSRRLAAPTPTPDSGDSTLPRSAAIKSQPDSGDPDAALRIATLAAYPDRVARRRAERVLSRSRGPTQGRQGETDLALADGGTARLSPASVVQDSEFLVAVDAEERRAAATPGRPPAPAGVLVRLASAIEPEWLLDLFPERVRDVTDLTWNPAAERVESVGRLLYESLTLDESKSTGADPAAVSRRLAEEALARGPSAFAEEGALDRLLSRVAFVREAAPDATLPALDDATVREALTDLCAGRRSFAELREVSLLDTLRARLGHEKSRALEKLAPDRITLPGGRSVRLEYEQGKPPWLASRLQDFFGMTTGPTVAAGRVPVVLHLQAPNRRALQVTTDLAGFWDRHYPAIRRELSRKYPRHPWPENPRTAQPPFPSGRRR